MSSFHPETWNPVWSVSTILVGLLSFMLETTPTMGSIETTEGVKRRLASESLAWNVMRGKDFAKVFPELVELHATRQAAVERAAAAAAAAEAGGGAGSSSASGAAPAGGAHAAPADAGILGGANGGAILLLLLVAVVIAYMQQDPH